MKNAVPAFRFRFSLVDDALKLLVESCRNTADFVTLVLIVPYAADVSMENSLTLATPSMCRRTLITLKILKVEQWLVIDSVVVMHDFRVICQQRQHIVL